MFRVKKQYIVHSNRSVELLSELQDK